MQIVQPRDLARAVGSERINELKVIGDVTVALPYTMDFCAKGPDVEPLFVDYKNVHITVFFPPSMSDGTVGQSFFPSGWAWWTGQSLRITLEQPLLESDIDMAALRTTMRDAANWILFQLLNAYRARMDRPEIYPVKIDPKLLVLTIEYSNGEVDAFQSPKMRSSIARSPTMRRFSDRSTRKRLVA